MSYRIKKHEEFHDMVQYAIKNNKETTNQAGIFTINSLADIYQEFKAKRREENWKNRKF